MLAGFTKRNRSETSKCFEIVLRCLRSKETRAESVQDSRIRLSV